MGTRPISVEYFRAVVPSFCDAGTASNNGLGWSIDNPTWGHCAVVALLAQNHFGGKLLRVSLEGTPFATAGSHYYNQFPDGSTHDFTQDQFGDWNPDRFAAQERPRDYVINGADTKRRYTELAYRFAQAVNLGNRLFHDPLYKACLIQALSSPCKKMGFGSVITYNGDILIQTNNSTIDPLRDLCEGECIRHKIQSRTESMIGACGHAEELALWELFHKSAGTIGYHPKVCNLYVAGVHADGLPFFKTEPEHTCLRCSVQIYHADIGAVMVPVKNQWQVLTPSQCVQTAKAYALKQKKA